MATLKRNAKAVWDGTIKEGTGRMSAPSGVLKETRYAFSTRFENEAGTNPEELIAAALAGCFSMKLSGDLGANGMTPEHIETDATLTMEKGDKGWSTTEVHLDVIATVPGADEAAFQKVAESAKANCPVSQLLNTEVTLTARLA